MERSLLVKLLTIELKNQKEDDSSVNRYLDQEKTMNVPVENTKESDIKGLFVKDVELR